MSEGLNLQTAGRLINYDMPWNLMRVEQRIGRIDRVGSRYREIQVTNYFYADTVEQRVYEGIAGDYTDFTDIVGNAQPVLGAIEKTIEQLALADTADQGTGTEDAVGEIKNDLAGLAAQPVQSSDLGDTPEIIGHIDPPPMLSGAVTLEELEATLTSNGLTRDRFTPVEGRPGVYRLALPRDDHAQISFCYTASPAEPSAYSAADLTGAMLVTFRREVADTSRDDLSFLTFGSPQLAVLLPPPEAETPLESP
jgi:hypothetical protein